MLKSPILPTTIEKVNQVLAPYQLADYIPLNTYHFVAPESVANALVGHVEGVVQVVKFPADLKLQPSLFALFPYLNDLFNRQAGTKNGELLSPAHLSLRVHLGLPPFNNSQIVHNLTESWVTAIPKDSKICLQLQKLRVVGTSQVVLPLLSTTKQKSPKFAECAARLIYWLTQQPLVHWIERQAHFAPMNKWAHLVTQTGKPGNPLIWNKGLRGEGQVIAIADTGLDYDSCFFFDPNVSIPFNSVNFSHRKIVRYVTTPDEVGCEAPEGGDAVDGHGTHTGGTAAGEVLTSDAATYANLSAYNGMAFKAKLCIYDYLTCPKDNDLFLPLDIYTEFFNDSYTKANARLCSNSWGDPGSEYDSYTWESDRFMFDHQDYLVVFAAGNSGERGMFTITIPGIAKNALTVGSSHNHPSSFKELGHQYGVAIVSPPQLAGNVQVLPADFGGEFAMTPQNYSVKASPSSEGCDEDWGDMVGVVALVWRGTCEFYVKALAAQKAGAVLLLVVNNVEDAPEIMYGPEGQNVSDIIIPLGMISKSNGERILKQLSEIKVKFPVSMVSNLKDETFLSEFSSRGPTVDGRLKPDVVAPGQPIISSRSDGNVRSFQCRDDDNTLAAMTGTSMATPVAAGSAALVRQYFVDGAYPALSALRGGQDKRDFRSPLAALVKAVVIHSGVALVGQVSTRGVTVNVTAPPSLFQGHGRIQLDTVLVFDQDGDGRADDNVTRGLWVNEGVASTVKQTDLYCFQATAGSGVKATLAWMDPPAAISALFALVNDLDLAVIDTARVSVGNAIPGAEDMLDNVNNVEVARVSSSSGKFVVRVATNKLPKGPQPYGLVVTAEGLQQLELAECEGAQLCLHNCSGHGRCEAGRCTCEVDWAGDDCSHAPVELQTNRLLLVSIGMWESKYFYYRATAASFLEVRRVSSEGDPDFFVNGPLTPQFPSPHSWELADQTCDICPGRTAGPPLSLVQPGLYRITAYGYCCAASKFSIRVLSDLPTPMGQPQNTSAYLGFSCTGACETLLVFSPVLFLVVLVCCCGGVVLCSRCCCSRYFSRPRFTELVTHETDAIMEAYDDKETIELVDKYYASDDDELRPEDVEAAINEEEKGKRQTSRTTRNSSLPDLLKQTTPKQARKQEAKPKQSPRHSPKHSQDLDEEETRLL